jgi:hypothetical protein
LKVQRWGEKNKWHDLIAAKLLNKLKIKTKIKTDEKLK